MAVVHRSRKKPLSLLEKGPRPGGTEDRSFRPTATNHSVQRRSSTQRTPQLAVARNDASSSLVENFASSRGYCWDRFTRQRHQRVDADPQFDEGAKKFEKFGTFSFVHDDPYGVHASKDEFVSGQHWRSGPNGVQFAEQPEAEEAEDIVAAEDAKFIGLRKARFFEGCLRADRAFDTPRLPFPGTPRAAPPRQISEERSPRPGTGKSEDRVTSPRSNCISPGVEQSHGDRSLSPDSPRLDRSMSPAEAAPTQGEKTGRQQVPFAWPFTPRRLGGPNVTPKVGRTGYLPAVNGAPPVPFQTSFAPETSETSLTEDPPMSIAKSMSGFVTSCKEAPIIPGTTGIIRANGEKLQLEHGFMTDVRAEAIIHTLRASSSDVKEAHFSANGLTERGARHLLSALPDDVEHVDLSQNDLGQNTSWCRSFTRLYNLQTLDISDSQLGDNICKMLCESLAYCKQLKTLNLNGNHIFKAAAAVAELIHTSPALAELDIHWNHIAGDSARDLVRGLLDGGHKSGSLSKVNLSYNPIGKGGDDACKLLAQVFVDNKVLRHLDISVCDLSAAQCQILADGFAHNTTILGLHIGGNEASISAHGFIVPHRRAAVTGALTSPNGGGPNVRTGLYVLLGSNVESSEPPEGSPQNASGDAKAKKESCLCWECDRWKETRIFYTPGISGPDTADVWLYTSIDNFKKEIKLTKHGEHLVTYIMCPPGTLQYVFQVGDEMLPSRTAPVQSDVKPEVCLRRLLAPGESDEDESGAKKSLEVIVTAVNTKVIAQREKDAPVCDCVIPRRIGEIKQDRSDARWSVENSLFGPYYEPLEKKSFCERCFEYDWHNCSIVDIIEDDNDLQAVREILRAHYAEIKVLYASLCSVEHELVSSQTEPLTFGITLNEFTHMLVQHHILASGTSGDELTLPDADAQFLLAAAPLHDHEEWADATHKQGKLVLRHGFFELLVRLALARFRRDDIIPPPPEESPAKTKAKSASHALDILLNKHIMYPHPPMKYNFNCVQWRVDVLHSEEVEKILRKHMKTIIDPLFLSFSRLVPNRLGRYLQLEDWFELLDGLNVLPCVDVPDDQSVRNTWDRSWVWQIAGMSHIDELKDIGHLLLSWPEFLEAITRLVGLLAARKRLEAGKAEDKEKTDYGLGACSPSYAFCIESNLSDRQLFAGQLDTFLSQDKLKQLLHRRASKV